MGSYLSEPITEKSSADETSDKLNCGASSMQGWRVSQEDAHNSILDFDENTSLFAVYDGHGGHEVAQYCSQNLPQYIKNTEAYKSEDMEKALIDAFLGFDATIATPEVTTVLKVIAGDKEAAEDSDEEENVNNLYEEAAMPIEQVIEKYTSNLINPHIKNLQKDVEKAPTSPYLKAKRESDSAVGTSISEACSSVSSASKDGLNDDVSSTSSVNDSVSSNHKDNSSNASVSVSNKKMEKNGASEVNVNSPDSSNTKELITSSKSECDTKARGDGVHVVNGEVTATDDSCDAPNNVTSSSNSVQENGDVSRKGKGKAIAKTKGVEASPASTRPKRGAKQLYKKWIADFEDDSDESDEEDKTFEGPNESSDDDDEEEGINIAIEDENSEDSLEEEEDEDEEEDEVDEDGTDFTRNMKDEPGFDSGCTAVVALMRGNELYVANAGDSRCIVCRNGKAVEMSIDHKPEDKPERERVMKAGGEVTNDGRVNGGLNLSRAIGDHAYKQNLELSDREQMITALPDVRKLTIEPAEDEFMVLACDGIWNSMSSQEVVDFVKSKLNNGCEKLSQICEALFDHCLAPDTIGDGTGCDNMTAILVQFKKSNSLKRSASPHPENVDSDSKRAKTEDSDSQIDTTA